MSARYLLKLRRVFGFLLLLFALCIEARAQVRFVQITDPHLFDGGAEASANREALTAFVKKINERVDEGNIYRFVVVTGDIGVEKLVENLIPKDEKKATGKERERIEQEIKKEIGKGVGVLSSILASSKVRLWLFVPGNNDLYQENPKSIGYYHQFIEQLASTLKPLGIEVRDLCPKADNPFTKPYANSAAYVYGPYAFIGFNNASFKNSDNSQNLIPLERGSGGLSPAKAKLTPDHLPLTPDELKLIPDELKELQGEYVEQVRSLLGGTPDGKKFSFAYVFYHIPEVDDPYLISGDECGDEKVIEKICERRDAAKGGAFDISDAACNDEKLIGKLCERRKAVKGGAIDELAKYSSWFVHRDVRDQWYKLIADAGGGKLAGLFAGHLHDWKRETYQNYHWLKTTGYPSASLSQLYICPPLAVKLQSDQPDQARGFMEISIDSRGRILDEWGRGGAHIFWYNPITKSFTGDENEKEVEWLNQLALGRILEDSGRLDEAEAAYTKALASKSAITRRKASEFVQRVAEKRVFPLNRYFFTPWGFSLSFEGIVFLVSISLLLTLSAMWLGGKPVKNVLSLLDLIVLAAGFVLLIGALWLTAWGVVIAATLLLILLAVWLASRYFVRLVEWLAKKNSTRLSEWLAKRHAETDASAAYFIILAVTLAAPVVVPSPPVQGLLVLDGILLSWVVMWLAGWRLKGASSIGYFLTLMAGFVSLVFLLWLAGKLTFASGASVSPRKAVSLAIVVIMLDVWLLSHIMKRRGRNVLVVSPLTDTTEHKLGATFPHILLRRRDDIISLRKPPGGPVSNYAVSVIMAGEETDLTDLIESAVPGGFGKIASWLARKASRPQHYLRGSLQPSGTNLMMIIIVESAGREPKVWPEEFPAGDLLSVEMELAYKVLIYTEAPELWQ